MNISFHQEDVCDFKETELVIKTVLTVIVSIFLGIILELFGNGLLYGIFIYEKYGVDSQRRTMINMLLSHICFSCIFLNIFSMPFWIYGIFLSSDGIGYHLALWTGFVNTSSMYYIGFSMAQIMILKCLYLTKWSTMALLDDYFFETFLTLNNILMAIMISFIRLGMGEFDSNIHIIKLTRVITERTNLHETISFW